MTSHVITLPRQRVVQARRLRALAADGRILITHMATPYSGLLVMVGSSAVLVATMAVVSNSHGASLAFVGSLAATWLVSMTFCVAVWLYQRRAHPRDVVLLTIDCSLKMSTETKAKNGNECGLGSACVVVCDGQYPGFDGSSRWDLAIWCVVRYDSGPAVVVPVIAAIGSKNALRQAVRVVEAACKYAFQVLDGHYVVDGEVVSVTLEERI